MRSSKNLLTLTVVLVSMGVSSSSEASKFTHPLRAYGTLKNVKVYRTKAALKKSKPIRSNYPWAKPTINRSTCVFVGVVSKLSHIVDSWKIVNLKKRLIGKNALVAGPCNMRIDKGKINAEFRFSPIYKGKHMSGTSASGSAVTAIHSLTLGEKDSVVLGGFDFALSDIGVSQYAQSNRPGKTEFAFDVSLVASRASDRLRADFQVSTEVPPEDEPHYKIFQDIGGFSVFLKAFKSRNEKLLSVDLLIFEKSP